MNPGWLSFVLSCVLALIALVSVFALLRFKTEAQGKQVDEVKNDIKEVGTDIKAIKEKLSDIVTGIKVTNAEQGAFNQKLIDGLKAALDKLEKLDTRVINLEKHNDGKSN